MTAKPRTSLRAARATLVRYNLKLGCISKDSRTHTHRLLLIFSFLAGAYCIYTMNFNKLTMSDSSMTCVWATARTSVTSWEMCTYPSSLDKPLSHAIHRTSCWWECEDAAWMQRLLRAHNHSLLVDVGGNIGFYTLAAAAVHAAVVVFEPHPINALHLLHSLRRNNFRNVHLHGTCASDRVQPCTSLEESKKMGGNLPFIDGRLRHGHRIAGEVSEVALATESRAARYFVTLTTPIDALVAPQRRPTFLKVCVYQYATRRQYAASTHLQSNNPPRSLRGATPVIPLRTPHAFAWQTQSSADRDLRASSGGH